MLTEPKVILNKFFGYTEFRTSQEEIINSIIEGQNVLAILPTGGGKSICYQIPSLMSKTFGIVISPLIALMKDQVDSINSQQPIAAFINSTLDYRETEKVLENFRNGKFKLLYLSPEKLNNQSFIERIKSLNPEYVFVDEAHCISEWGHNFRPGYRKIKSFIDYVEIKKVAAFTATATSDVRKDIIDQLGLASPKIIVRGFERANFHLHVFQTPRKKEKLVEILSMNPGCRIIYAATRKLTEEIAEHLRSYSIDAVYYHAGLTAELRRLIQDDFISGRVQTIVATNAFGMGIDKSNIRSIIHFNMPGTIENYYQEIGRAGRDGNESNIFLLYDEKDKIIQQFFINTSFPTREQIEIVYDALCNRSSVALGTRPDEAILLDKNFYSLVQPKKISNGIAESAIRVLEESGYTKGKSPAEHKHFCKFLLEPSKLSLYVKFFADNEMKDLVVLISREYGGNIFSQKTSLSIHNLARTLDTTTDEIIDQLETLSRAGILEYERPTFEPSVYLTTERVKAADLKLNLDKTKNILEHSKLKLEKMIGYVFSEECRFKYILEYFGQTTTDYKCGKCDRCSGSSGLKQNTLDYLEEIILQTVHEAKIPLKKKYIVQLLTGKSKHPSIRKFSTYGTCIHFKNDEIERAIDSLIHSKMLLGANDTIVLAHAAIEEYASPANDEKEVSNANFENELKLFNLLRQVRKEAAAKFNQPAEIICPDEVLRLITKEKPATHSALLKIKGFNKRILNKVGDEFLNLIREFKQSSDLSCLLKNKNLPDQAFKILELVQKKYSLFDIASFTKLPESIVSAQIETLIEMIPGLEINSLFEKKEFEIINKKIDSGITDLKELRTELENKIGYAKLRIALAKKRVT